MLFRIFDPQAVIGLDLVIQYITIPAGLYPILEDDGQFLLGQIKRYSIYYIRQRVGRRYSRSTVYYLDVVQFLENLILNNVTSMRWTM